MYVRAPHSCPEGKVVLGGGGKEEKKRVGRRKFFLVLHAVIKFSLLLLSICRQTIVYKVSGKLIQIEAAQCI